MELRLLIVTADGTVLGEVENIEEYNLSKPMARTVIMNEIQRIIEQAQMEEKA